MLKCLNNNSTLWRVASADTQSPVQLTRSVCRSFLRRKPHRGAYECCASLQPAEHHRWPGCPSKYPRVQLPPWHTQPGTGGLGNELSYNIDKAALNENRYEERWTCKNYTDVRLATKSGSSGWGQQMSLLKERMESENVHKFGKVIVGIISVGKKKFLLLRRKTVI